MMIGLGLALLAAQAAPSYVRAWTYLTGDYSNVLGIRAGTVYYQSAGWLGAVDVVKGTKVWEVAISPSSVGAFGDSEAYLVVGERPAKIVAFSLKKGVRRQVAAIAGEVAHIAWGGGKLFALSGKVVRALDSAGKTKWTRELKFDGKPARLDGGIRVVGTTVVVGFDGPGFFALDAATGKPLWNRNEQYAILYPPIAVGADALMRHDGLSRVDPRTGKVRWTNPASAESMALVKGVLVCESEDRIVGIDWATGRTLWSKPGGDEGFSTGGFREERLGIADQNAAWVQNSRFMGFSPSGDKRWEVPTPFGGDPLAIESATVVCVDSDRLMGYRRGVLPALPTDDAGKAALAKDLAARYEMLDPVERSRLALLKPYSAEPLLKRFVEWAKLPDSASLERRTRLSQYGILTEAARTLDSLCEPQDTGAIVRALNELGATNSYSDWLTEVLQRHGDQAAFVPFLLKRIESAPNSQAAGSALPVVAASSVPEAVDFMIRVLNDPKRPAEWRAEAYRRLAGTGKARGLEAVLKARPTRRALVPWKERINVGKLDKREIVQEAKDAKGRTWRLFHAVELGNYSDLYIAERRGNDWGPAIFVGTYTEHTFRGEAPKSFRGIPMDRLVKTDWIKIFPDDPETVKDSDGDGLTDLVEARLGTDPKNKDTDGDGWSDEIDPCPNAAPRALGDKEKIVEACLQARFFQQDWGAPGLISVEGVEPFEIAGYGANPLIWAPKSGTCPLNQIYGGGVNLLNLHGASEQGGPDIQFSADGREAVTVFSRYSGGLNGDGYRVKLRKFGDDWLVVEMTMAYVS